MLTHARHVYAHIHALVAFLQRYRIRGPLKHMVGVIHSPEDNAVATNEQVGVRGLKV
jgi:hypothetical protein